ncbi:MAG TPA: hypothetical protein VEP49_00955, partial [Acidimicrobiia bacterium]|nr:hypothetical protein [Acidimicrobiia bacterium]
AAALLVIFLAPVSWLRTDYVDAVYQKVSDPDHALPYATELRARTLPSDRVVVDGYDWNPAILYYAHRDGMMLAPSAVYPGLYRDLSRSGYNTWLAVNGGTGQFDQIGTWPWVGVESNHAYRLGHSAADVDRAHVVATNDAAALASSGAGQSTSSTAVLCNGKEFRVPAGAQGTWFVPTARSPAGLRISFDRSAPLPAFAAYVVRTGKPGAAISVTCSGPPSVSLRVKDAPVP